MTEQHLIPGALLTPDLADLETIRGSRTAFYWTGCLPGCPVEAVDIAGVHFPKVQLEMAKIPGSSQKQARIPAFGALQAVSEHQIHLLRELIPRTVVRFHEAQREEAGTGTNTGDDYVRPRRGFVLRAQTEAELKIRRDAGRIARAYRRQPGDEPIARYLYAVLCTDQSRPRRGTDYPDTLDVTGIATLWPAADDELADL